MVYTFVFLIGNTILFILCAVGYFSLNNTAGRAGSGVAIILYVGK